MKELIVEIKDVSDYEYFTEKKHYPVYWVSSEEGFEKLLIADNQRNLVWMDISNCKIIF